MMESSLSLAGRLVPETDLLVPSPSEERADVEPQLALLTTLCWGLMASRTRLGGKWESDEALEEYWPPSDVLDGELLIGQPVNADSAPAGTITRDPQPFNHLQQRLNRKQAAKTPGNTIN